MEVRFEIIEVNLRRRARGAGWVKVNIFEDGERVEWLWMDEKDIKNNKNNFGESSFVNTIESFIQDTGASNE